MSVKSIATKIKNVESNSRVYLFVCLFGDFRPINFTRMEASPLLVKGCKFRPMFCTYGHRAVKECITYCDKGHPFIMVISGDPLNLQPVLTT